MTFKVYPDPPTNPLALAAGTTSAAFPISDDLFGSGSGVARIFLRYVLVGTDCAPPVPPAPTVFLVTDGIEHEIKSLNNVDPTPVAGGKALATVIPGLRAVFRLEISKFTSEMIEWRIRFRNNHAAAAHQLTWVVANAEAETRQPWIEVAHEAVWSTLPSGGQPGEAVSLPVRVANKGTGDLVISDVPGRLENSDFTLLTVPPRIAPNVCGNLEFQFTPPASPGLSTVSYTATSNDSTALTGSPEESHNKRLQLVAEVGIPKPAFSAVPSEFTPREGRPGETVTLNGRNFDVGTPEVRFGSVAAALVGSPTPTGVTTVVPVGLPPGRVQITVTTEGGTAVSRDRFAVLGLPPQLGGFTPPRGRAQDPSTPGTIVTITGNHFEVGETTVTFRDEPAVVDDMTNTEILTRVPTVPSGNYLITVATQWGEDRSTNPFVVDPRPAFNASRQFSPAEGAPGITVTLNGRNFGPGTPGVRFGTVAAASVGVPTSAGVTAVVPAGLPLGGVQITVTADGGTAVSEDFFTVVGPPPQLDRFTPPSGRSEDLDTSTPGTIVTITGNHFDENVGVETTVTFGDEPAVVNDITNTRIRTTVPAIPGGNHFITVATEWGEDRSADPFTVVPKPAFNVSRQFSPADGAPGITVTLNGRNFGPGTPGVRFGTVAAASVGVPTSAGVTAVVPAGLPLGGVQITVTTDGGTAISDDFFTVRGSPPQLDGFTPPKGRSEDPATSTPGTIVTITGNHFEIGGTTVTFGDKPAVIDDITNTRIRTKVPAIPVGNYPITVATQWGQARSTVSFVVQAISTSGELARRTRIRAFRREPSNVLIVARGENPTSGYRVDIEQSPEDVSPPQFNLLRFPPSDIKPPPVAPYRYEEIVPFPPDKPRITINHAGGSDVVNIGRTYVVQRGDTMSEIASNFRISLEALTAANPQIPNINRINVGQPINIPPTYVVQSGDTMSEIAVKFGVSLEALKAENPQIRNPNLIRTGQVIVIP